MSNNILTIITSYPEIFNIELLVNIILHITILFTILTNLYIYYAANKSADIINNNISHIINDQFTNVLNNNSEVSTKIRELYTKYTELIELYNSNTLLQSELNIVKNKITDISLQLNNLYFINNISSSETSTQFDFNSINQFFKSFSFDYYLNLFNTDNQTRKLTNNLLFSNLKIINILLIIFFIIFTGTLYGIGAITLHAIMYIFIENIITFIFVGLIEVLFFYNVILKYVPISPSLLISSFISSLKKLL